MAREYARYLTKTHRDPDWHALSTAHHDAYMALLSSDDITWAGVAPYMPARYGGLATDLTARKVERLWADLDRARFLVLDKGTGEILVRSFLRHDNVIAKPNLTKAFCQAWRRVRSDRINEVLMDELRRILHEAPKLSGWNQIEELMPEQFGELFPELFAEQFEEL